MSAITAIIVLGTYLAGLVVTSTIRYGEMYDRLFGT